MALTKAEAAKLTNDMFLRGVIETIIYQSSILQLLPFMEITGTALTYNRESTMPAAAFYAPLDNWTEAAPTFTQETAALKILGGDADVDNFLQQTYANPNDLEAAVIESRAKAVAHKFSDTFYNGDTGTDPNSFDGLVNTVAAGQTIYTDGAGAAGAVLDLAHMDELIDLIKPGRPDALLLSKSARRKLSALRRASGNLLETTVDAFGRHAIAYDGIPLLVDDWIPTTETVGADSDCTSIYAIKFGTDGVTGLENGGIQVQLVGEVQDQDATRHRIKWYCGMAVFSDYGLARLAGVQTA